jgi:hypothetical protein
MPQPQDNIAVEGKIQLAVKSGNNAAWLCECGALLVGHTCSNEQAENDRVDCRCGKRFFVIGERGRFTKAVKIVEAK